MITLCCNIGVILCGVVSIIHSILSLRETERIQKRWDALNARREQDDNSTS